MAESRVQMDDKSQSKVLSIVVPAFNEALELPNLFASLEPLRTSVDCEVIVVDNGSTDDTAKVAEKFGVSALRIERSTVAAARNAGAKVATGRVIVFLDGDIVVTDSWRKKVVELASSAEWSGEITGDVCDVGVQPSWLEKAWFAPMYRRGASRYLNSGNLLVCRQDFNRIEGFSSNLVTGEDVDFCIRAEAKGIVVKSRRELHVHHNGYPRSIGGFFRRESWHGRGDFSSWTIFRKSKVAQLALAIAGLHVVAIAGLVFGSPLFAVLSVLGIVGACLATSVWKWRKEPIRLLLINAFVFYIYFLGRAWAGWRQLREK